MSEEVITQVETNGYRYWETYGYWSVLIQTVPTLFKSIPGRGKTKFCQSLAKSMATDAGPAEVIEIVPSHLDPTEVNGAFMVDKEAGAMVRLMSEFAYRAQCAHAEGRKVIIVLEEIMRASNAQRAPVLRIVSEFMIGDVKLDRELTHIVLTGNPEGSGVSSSFDAADSNRVAHEVFANDPENVVDGFCNGFDPECLALPDGWREHLPQYKMLIAAYFQANPDAICRFPKEPAEQKGAWPSERSWDNVARFLAGMASVEPDPDADERGHGKWSGIRCKGIYALIGDGDGRAFNEWLSTLDLFTMDEIREALDTGELDMPTRGDKVFITCGMIRNAVLEGDGKDGKADNKRWLNGFKLLSNCYEQGNGDIIFMVACDFLKHKHPSCKIPPKQAKVYAELMEIGRD